MTEFDLVTFIQEEGLVQGAGPDGGSLQVEEETYRASPRCIGSCFPHMGGDLTSPFMGCMAHVQSERISTRVDEGADGVKGFGGRTESSNESGAAHGTNL